MSARIERVASELPSLAVLSLTEADRDDLRVQWIERNRGRESRPARLRERSTALFSPLLHQRPCFIAA